MDFYPVIAKCLYLLRSDKILFSESSTIGNGILRVDNPASFLSFGTGYVLFVCQRIDLFLSGSLNNIFKEIHQDLGKPIPASGNLDRWVAQGVFPLNSVLTVRAHETGSHRNMGWEIFTDAVIRKLSEKRENLIFMLWGNYAKEKLSLIDTSKHLVLTSVHPSPRSAEYGFFGCKHFSKANAFLRSKGIEEIDW